MIEILTSHTAITISMLTGWILFILITYFKAYRFDKYGIRSKAKISSIYEVENFHDPDEPLTISHEAKIEYKNGDKLVKTKLYIHKKYTDSIYASNLPIIYQGDKPEFPIIDDASIIYRIPKTSAYALIIVLFLVLTLIFIEFSFL